MQPRWLSAGKFLKLSQVLPRTESVKRGNGGSLFTLNIFTGLSSLMTLFDVYGMEFAI